MPTPGSQVSIVVSAIDAIHAALRSKSWFPVPVTT
jgi:hypothetical protein